MSPTPYRSLPKRYAMHIFRCHFLNADDHIEAFEVIEVASLRRH